MNDPIVFGRPFVLRRDRDISGVSGVGIVADGIVFPDGHAAIHWRGKWALTTPHPDGLDSILDIHDHGGQGDLHIIWPDHGEMRQKVLADVVEAFDVPAEMCGTEAERAHLHRQISRVLTAEHLRRAGEQIVASPEEHCASFANVVMRVVGHVLEQRDRAKAVAGRAYVLADRWQAAHGASQFLVRAAGAELRDELDGPGADESSPAAKHFVHAAANVQASAPEKADENGLQRVYGAPVEEPDHACVEAAMQRAIAADLRLENRALREKAVLLERTCQALADERQRTYRTVEDARISASGAGAWGVLQALERVPAPDVTLASHGIGTSEWTKTGPDSANAQAREGAEEDSPADTVTDPAWMRELFATAIRKAACVGGCGAEEEECEQRRIQPYVWHHGVLAQVTGTPEVIADAVLTVRDWHLERLRQRLALAEAALGDRAEAESADAAAGSYAHRAEQAETERDQLAAEAKRLGDWCRTMMKRAKNAAAERDRYHDELAVNETDRVAAVRRAERAEAALTEARATGQRLNRRAQVAESGLATIRRAVAQWSTDERGTYVPLRTITAIAKAVGREVENPRWLLHYQRVEQAETALVEAQQVISMQKALIGSLRSVVATAMTDREDQGVSREECGRDHMAELETAIREADIEYRDAFPPTADGPARPGRLPDGAHRTPRQSAYEAVQAHIDSLGAGWPSTKSGQTAHIWIAVNRALDAAGHDAAPETVCTLPHEMET